MAAMLDWDEPVRHVPKAVKRSVLGLDRNVSRLVLIVSYVCLLCWIVLLNSRVLNETQCGSFSFVSIGRASTPSHICLCTDFGNYR